MNDFDRRWRECAARVRAEAAGPVLVPAGVATRAWAQWTAQSSAFPAAAWPALALRALILASIALLLCAATEFYTTSSDSVFAPHVEDVVTSVWGNL